MDTSDRAGAIADDGLLTEKFLAIRDSIPSNTSLKQEGLQPAEASSGKK